MKKFSCILLFPLIASGCASMQQAKPKVSAVEQAATLQIYREPSFVSSMSSLYFGETDSYYFSLDNQEYAELQVAPGRHQFFASARGSRNYTLDIDLAPGSKTCLKTVSYPYNYAKMAIPLVMNFTSVFKMEAVPCPDQQFLASYRKIEQP